MSRLTTWLSARSLAAFEPDSSSGRRARLLMTAFYAYVAAVALAEVARHDRVTQVDPVAPVWPVAWAEGVWEPATVTLIVLLGVVAVAGLLAHHSRPVRIGVFVVLLLHVAALSSFGKINHGFHHLLTASFFLALAPTYGDEPAPGTTTERRLHGAILLGQAALLTTYTLSGGFKLVAGVRQAVAGQVGLFSGESLSRIVASRVLETAQRPPLADLVLAAPALSSVLYLVTVLVELTAVATVLAPPVSTVWAVVLMAFHYTVFWSMGINFLHSTVALGVLFLLSPFWRVPWVPRRRERRP